MSPGSPNGDTDVYRPKWKKVERRAAFYPPVFTPHAHCALSGLFTGVAGCNP
jgi:hypothetical protein